jgi:hypothetical protein
MPCSIPFSFTQLFTNVPPGLANYSVNIQPQASGLNNCDGTLSLFYSDRLLQ